MAVRDPGTVADYQSRRAILMFLTRSNRESRTVKKGRKEERKSENGTRRDNTIIYMVGKEEGGKTRTCGRGGGRQRRRAQSGRKQGYHFLLWKEGPSKLDEDRLL